MNRSVYISFTLALLSVNLIPMLLVFGQTVHKDPLRLTLPLLMAGNNV